MTTESVPIPRLPRQESYALSAYQRGIWALVQASPDNPFYNASRIIKLIGPLDLGRFHCALEIFIARHDVLRTSFASTEHGPVQRVAAAVEVGLPLEDLSQLPAARREARLHQWIEETAWTPFDLGTAPLIRFRVFRFAAADHRLALTAHHLVSDGTSGRLMMEELAVLYPALCAGSTLPPPPALQYHDFSHWQNAQLESGKLDESERYWLHRLGGDLPSLELPADRRRPAVASYRGAQHRRLLSAGLTRKLKELCRKQRTTVFRLMLAALDTLFVRLGRETDLIVGSPVSGRTHPALRDLQGLFVNMLALRVDLGGDPSFTEVLARVKESTREDIDRRDFPFDVLVRRLNPPREPGRPPIFNVVLIMREPSFASELPAGPLVLSQDEVPLTRVSRYDLTLIVAETGPGLRLTFEYSSDLFDPGTVIRLAGTLEQLLAAVAADPDERISRLPLLGESERAAVLLEWNDTRREGAVERWLPRLLERQAELHPEALALACGGQVLSYRELLEEAGQMARRLSGLGLMPGEAVGVALGRSALLVPALLAIWRAGGSYVPMDPSYPQERLAYMLADAGCRLVLVDETTPPELVRRAPVAVWLGNGSDGRYVLGSPPSRDSRAPAIPSAAGKARRLPAVPDTAPAYILYTSGSTGRPKGVEVPHAALVNFLAAMAEQPGLGAGDVLLAVTSLSFDIAGLELYLPLFVGARIELASREEAADGALLLARLRKSGATVMQATPSTWRMLIDAGWQGQPRLKVLCGGEALPEKLAAELVTRSRSVWNLYGPTETTIWSAAARVLPEAAVTLGRPIANTSLYVLGSDLEPAPIGVPGELYIGGDGVALGYRRRPELTAERFLPDPFAGRPGARFYRTGDLVRRRARGEIEFLGRIDHQVKVRGFRIELGEVQSALEEQPEVAQAVVVAQAGPAEGAGRLVAYVVPRPAGAALAVSTLRTRLARTLPAYMIPEAWVVLAELPLTPNGKVDRKALAAASPPASAPESTYVPPRDAVEWELAELWEEALGVRGIGVLDNFFALGGHSLIAVSLVAEVHRRFGIRLSVAALAQAPTIAAMRAALKVPGHPAHAAARFAANLVPIRAGGPSEPPLLLVHAHRGTVFAYHALAIALGDRYPIYGLQAQGLGEGEEPLDSIPAMAARYIEQIRTLQPEGPYRLAGWSLGGVVAYEMARQLESRGEVLAILALLDASPPDDPAPEALTADTLPRIGRAVFGLDEAVFAGLDESRALELLLKRGRELDLLPAAMTPEPLGRLLRVVMAHSRALAAYRLAGSIDADICLLRATTASQVRDPDAWRRRTRRTFSLVTVPGSHHEMVFPPAVGKLAEALSQALERGAAKSRMAAAPLTVA